MINLYKFKDKADPLYISSMGDYVAGIGLGFNGRIRSRGEMLERYALRRGPSKKMYFIDTGEMGYNYCVGLIDRHSDILDSSGSAININIYHALNSAFMEFCERQSLVYAWRFGSSYELIHPKLLQSGIAYESRDISLFEGVHVILTLLVEKCGKVNYAVGCSASDSLEIALEKSRNELFQSIDLMNDNIQRDMLGIPLMDDIQKIYLESNNESTFFNWKFVESNPVFNLNKNLPSLVDKILSLPYAPKILVDKVYFEEEVYYLVRVLSEDWFLGLRDLRFPKVYKSFSNVEFNNSPVPFG